MQDIFLNILRTQAQTVYVISSGNSDSKEAMTVSSVASLSADPPRMLVCINKSAAMHDFLKTTQSFCLNLLSNGQKHVADICSNSEKINERFSNDSWLNKDLEWIPAEKEIIEHMNQDHSKSIISTLSAQHNVKDEKAKMIELNIDGFYCESSNKIYFLTFKRPCFTVDEIRKELIVQARENRAHET